MMNLTLLVTYWRPKEQTRNYVINRVLCIQTTTKCPSFPHLPPHKEKMNVNIHYAKLEFQLGK